MKLDIPLIHKVEVDLRELDKIVQEQLYDKQIILTKIKEVEIF